MAGTNPFASDGGSEKIEDPFEDPSVTAAATGYTPIEASNPFVLTRHTSAYEGGGLPEPPKPATKKQDGRVYTALHDDESKEAALLARERALIERERALDQKEQQMKNSGFKVKNWPFSCYPLAYHSITEEIPPAHRNLCRKFYVLIFATWICLLWNWLTILVILSESGGSGTDAMWASAFLVFGIPGSWKLWYRSVYYGLSTSSGKRWVFFFINFLMHIGFGIVMALGIPDTAGGGLFELISMYANNHDMAGMFCAVDLVIWTLNVLISLYLIKSAHLVWKYSGVPEQTQKEVVAAVAQQAVEQHA